MHYYIVETVYYKKQFIVYAASDLAARTKVSEWFHKKMNLNIRISELEAIRVSVFMDGVEIREL